MKKIFVAYADEKMAYYLKRIGEQAGKLGLFDDIILWTPQMLPNWIKTSPLMQYSYGGGFWAWKPCIIYETLQRHEEGTVVCYIDAGCTLRKGIEWALYFEMMKDYDTLCFKYRDEMPEWERFGSIKTSIEFWSKKELLLFLDDSCGTSEYRKLNKIWGGALFFKGKSNELLKEWLDITLHYPNLIMHPTKDELKEQYPFFAQHKHDQPVITALAYKYRNRCIVLPELSETEGRNVAIHATRCRASNIYNYYWQKIKNFGRYLLGGKICEFIKRKCTRSIFFLVAILYNLILVYGSK